MAVTAAGVQVARRSSLRWAALGGLVFAVLFVVHHLLQGAGPVDPTAAAVAAYQTAHRGALLASEVVLGVGLLAFLALLAPLVTLVRRAGQETLATALLVAGTVFLALGFVSTAAETALVGVAGRHELGAVAALDELQGRTPVVWAVTALVATVSLAARATGFLPRWLGGAGLGLAAVFLLASVSSLLGRSVEGGGSLVGVALFTAWVLALSACLWRAGRGAPGGWTPAAGRRSADRERP